MGVCEFSFVLEFLCPLPIGDAIDWCFTAGVYSGRTIQFTCQVGMLLVFNLLVTRCAMIIVVLLLLMHKNGRAVGLYTRVDCNDLRFADFDF